MKTLFSMLSAIFIAIIPISSSAQTVVFGGDPHGHPKSNSPSSPMASNTPKNNNKNNNQNIWINSGWSYGPGYGYGGNGVSVNINSGYPYGGYYNPYNNYNNGYGYNIKKAARYSIRRSAGILNQAIGFQNWNDYYSPLLAKAIRHQQYARQLYWWGDYNGAYNHAERAAFLAWHVMSFYQPGYSGYDDDGLVDNGGYNPQPNPYSDPYNPYYRKNQNSSNNPETINDDLSMKKQASHSGSQSSPNPGMNAVSKTSLQNEEMDSKLPSVNLSDQDLIKSIKAQDLDIE